MKYGIKKFYEPTPADGGGAPTGDVILKELGTIKDALGKKLSEDTAKIEKNLEEKIEATDTAIKAVEEKMAKGATAEEVAKLRSDLEVTIKALDIVQTQNKSNRMTTKGAQGQDNESFSAKLNDAIGQLKGAVHGDQIKGGTFKVDIQLKAVGDMTTAANLTGAIPNTYRTGIVPLPFENVHMRDIVNVTPSETDSYHFYRHTLGEGSIEFQNQELETKSQIDEDLLETTVNLNYLAGWLRISKKMLRNFKGLQGYLSRWLPERYYQREDTKAYQALISGATGVANADTGGGMIRQIIRTIGMQRKARYNVTGIVVDGAVWANILTYTASGSGEFTMPIGVVTISPTGTLMICGIPVWVASWVGGDQAIIGDWKFFEIIQSEGLSLQFFDQDGTNVRENKITARIEACVGFALLDPKAFVVQSLASVS